MVDKDIYRVASGTRRDMIPLERQMVTQNPRPLISSLGLKQPEQQEKANDRDR